VVGIAVLAASILTKLNAARGAPVPMEAQI
jgi:hypothetical protein